MRPHFLILLSTLAAVAVLTLPRNAHAALIIQRPLYIGLTDGLVGFWPFDGPDMTSTVAIDRSGSNNNGTLTNGPRKVTGRIGQGLEFDPVIDNTANAGNGSSLQITGAIMLSAWVFPFNAVSGSS